MENSQPPTINPSPVIANFTSQLKPGTVLVLGAGNPGDILFLAQQGLHVVAVDPSRLVLGQLQQQAMGLGVEVTIHLADLANYAFYMAYDNIVCNHALHFLPQEAFEPFLGNIQRHTVIDGVNIIADLIDNGQPTPKELAMRMFKPGELQQYYGGWKILSYQEAPLWTGATIPGQTSAEIVAKKV